MTKPKVIIRRAPEYDPVAIEKIIGEGLGELGLAGRIKGRITIKPNVVMAHPKVTPSAFTRSEFLDGVLGALKNENSDVKITIAEKCGAAISTSRMFQGAGYYRLARKRKVRLQPIEEAKKTTVALQKGKIHKTIRTAKEIVEHDFLVYTPKLKTNLLAQGLTAARILSPRTPSRFPWEEITSPSMAGIWES